ncbi:uncharacterized protein LOC124120546 isoform X2 [Haliotis rufescens]|uniref:uncharacterized protein LOC124120546 isoform X2 n=1 Tax=Haliotis rufescens TaxID=6454 RepID=UPI00201F86FB|nr:uncharacterized protein LOC124120546 isoform X2 [Haliotis rufescens]
MDHFPKCSICKQQFCYQGPPPWLLPCLHAVCKICLSAAETGTLKCSSCHKEFDKEKHKFSEDKVRAREIFNLTVLHRPSELQCTNKQDGGQAVVWCKQCEALFCENCQVAHSDFKITKCHTVQTIDQVAQDGVSIEAKDAVCSTHRRHVDFYDATCGVLICLRCTRDDHAGHDVQEVDEAFQSKQLEMKNKHNQLLIHQESLNESILQMKSIEEKVDKKCRSLQTLKDHTMSELKSLVDQREKELDLDLSTCFEHIRDGAREKQQELETSQMSLNTPLDYIEKALTLTPVEYLELQATMMQSVDSCLSEHVSAMKQQEAAEGVAFSRQGLQSLKADIASFGCFLTSPDQESQANQQQDNQGTFLQNKFEHLQRKNHELEMTQKMLKEKLTTGEEEKDLAHKQLQANSDTITSLERELKTQQTAIDTFKEQAEKIDLAQKQLQARCDTITSLEKKVKTQQRRIHIFKKQAEKLDLAQKQLQANSDTITSLEKEVKTQRTAIDTFMKLAEKIGVRLTSDLTLVSSQYTTGVPVKLNCPPLKFDVERANFNLVEVTERHMVNRPARNPPFTTRKLNRYSGTCGSMTLPYTLTSAPVTTSGSFQGQGQHVPSYSHVSSDPTDPYYFQAHAKITQTAAIIQTCIFEIVLSEPSNVDTRNDYGRGVKVGFCDTHKTICTHRASCYDQPLANRPGLSMLTYGVVYDAVRGKVAFIDVNKEKILTSMSVKRAQYLPMFGVQKSEGFTVEITLMEVKDTDISARLRGVIQQALQ